MMKYVIIGLVVASLVGALTISGKIILNQNTQIAVLETSVWNLQDAINKAVEAHAEAQEALAQLQVDYNKAEKSRSGLAELLARHDLEKLAKSKPGLVENIINKATKEKLQRFREFGNVEAPSD